MTETIQRGALYVVSTPIGNLADISSRAIHVLSSVDVIAAEDTRTTKVLLNHLHLSTPLLSYHSHNEHRRVAELIARLERGQAVALVTDAGTPGISDPAFLVTRDAALHGIRVIPIPGPSAVLAALVASGLPMDRFVFEGFLPVKKGRKSRLEALRPEERTIVLYESPHRIAKTLDDLQVALGDRRCAVGRELTKKFEEVVRGTLADVSARIAAREARGEYVVVIEGAACGGRKTE